MRIVHECCGDMHRLVINGKKGDWQDVEYAARKGKYIAYMDGRGPYKQGGVYHIQRVRSSFVLTDGEPT